MFASGPGLCLIKKKDGVQLALSKCKRRLKKGKEHTARSASCRRVVDYGG